MLKNRILISIILIFIMALCGAAAAFAEADMDYSQLGPRLFAEADIDYSQWNSGGHYPRDIMGTSLQIPVIFLTDRGIITGDTDGLFHPQRSISRAEFATMMAKATNNISQIEAMRIDNEEIFSDLQGYEWARQYINAVVRAGLFNGISEDKFAPGEDVTYAEAITVIIRMNTGAAGIAEGMAASWPDNYIMYARTYNIMGDLQIRDWDASAIRGDVAYLLHRALPKHI